MQRLAHDLAQFITVIWGNCELLARENPGCAESDRLADIRKAAHQMDGILRDALARVKPPARAGPQSLNTIVEELACLGVLRSQLRVVLELDPEMPNLAADAPLTSLHRALMNLCSNARHAMLRGCGKAMVYDSSAGEAAPAECGTLTIGTWALSEIVAVFVKDSGPGMSATEQAQVFSRMNGGDASIRDGHGYGLQFVKRLADEMGGIVKLESAVGKGTCFTLVLPRPAEASIAA